MKIQIKRAYEKPEKSDGTRVLVDRLWPRGVRKAKAKIDLWAKDAAPTNELRRWFHADPEKRFKEFSNKYAAELKKNAGAKEFKRELKMKGQITLVTAAKDVEHSHVPTFIKYLKV